MKRRVIMPITVAYILGLVCALAATILVFIFVTPEKKYNGLNKFFKVVADIFNFKQLLLEKILKVLYVFSTLVCIGVGFFMIFSGYQGYGYYDYYGSYVGGGFHSLAGYGILLIILGPIFVRILFEACMLTIILVKNVIDINKKLPRIATDDRKDTPDIEMSDTPVEKVIMPKAEDTVSE